MSSKTKDFCALTIDDLKTEEDEKENNTKIKEVVIKPPIKPIVEYLERTQVRILESMKETQDKLLLFGKCGYPDLMDKTVEQVVETTDKAFELIDKMHERLVNINLEQWDLEDEDTNTDGEEDDEDESKENKHKCVII